MVRMGHMMENGAHDGRKMVGRQVRADQPQM